VKIQEQLNTLITCLAESISSHLNRINSATVETSEKARVLNTHLNAIQSEYQALSSIVEKMKATQGQVKTEAQTRLGEAAEIQQKVEQAVQKAERVQGDMDSSTIEMIRKLEESEIRQRQRLANIRFWR
jgi:phage shock protein A